MDERIISSEANQNEISLEQSLRPQTLKQYIGQDQVKKVLKFSLRPQDSVRKHWIMCFFMDLLD